MRCGSARVLHIPQDDMFARSHEDLVGGHARYSQATRNDKARIEPRAITDEQGHPPEGAIPIGRDAEKAQAARCCCEWGKGVSGGLYPCKRYSAVSLDDHSPGRLFQIAHVLRACRGGGRRR